MPAPAGNLPELTVEGHLAALIDAPAFPRLKNCERFHVGFKLGRRGTLWSAAATGSRLIPFRIAA